MLHHILIVDDERALREELASFLHDEGFACAVASNADQAMELAAQRDFNVVLADVRMPGIDGIELVSRLRNISPQSQVLIMTAQPSVDTVVSALRLGVLDYIIKPLVLEDLLNKVRRTIELHAQATQLRWYRQQLQAKYDYSNLVGRSQAMREMFRVLDRITDSDTSVLITGESGTGKELVANALHHNGPRRTGTFVTVNCSAIPATLLESQLFGHVKGAFTGADCPQEGLFAAASGGTLCLDEIGDMSIELQPKLLRAVENQEIIPVGASRPLQIDTRVIASTNKNLKDEIERGRFREDLFYRLAVVSIHMPPLRERREDIPMLVEFFIRKLNVKLRRKIRGVTNEVHRRLFRYGWRGNVRELRNVIERAMILEEGDLISPSSLPSNLLHDTRSLEATGLLKDAIRKFERDYIGAILRATNGDKGLAAELLGVSVSSIYRKLQELEEELNPSPDPTERRE